MPIFRIKPEMQIGANLPSTKSKRLSSGINGNFETIEIMQRVARERSRHPLVRDLALKILLYYKVPSQHYRDEALAIGDWVKKKVRYVRDIKDVETLHDPLTIIDQIKRGVAQGDCDDMALLIASLLLSIGHAPYFKAIKYKKGFPSLQHIYVVVFERNQGETAKTQIALDAIMKTKPIGYEVPSVESYLFKA